MKRQSILALSALACSGLLTACGSDEKTTVIHDRPVVVNSGAGTTPGTVESDCAHGYDNRTRSCY